MNEGIGSSTIIVIIVVFIAIASAYMAYNVNYTKAFRVKNKIISLYEEYEGDCNGECQSEILKYAQSVGYNASDTVSDSSFCTDNVFVPRDPRVDIRPYTDPGYCIYRVPADSTDGSDIIDDCNHKGGYYYRVVTRIDIKIPIVQNFIGLRFLNVTGDTKVFKEPCGG